MNNQNIKKEIIGYTRKYKLLKKNKTLDIYEIGYRINIKINILNLF